MKIRKVLIQNYGSLREIQLDATELTVLIGANGSGKSFVLEGLFKFFDEFSPVGGGAPGGLSDYLWYNRHTKEPIKFTILIEMTHEEVEDIFSMPPDAVKIVEQKFGEKYKELEICRLISIQTGWKTEYIKWANLHLIKDDKTLTPDELTKSLFPKTPLTNYTFYFFTPGYTPQNIGGDRLLVDTGKNIAYFSSQQIDSLTAMGIIKASAEFAGQNWKQWVQQRGLSIMERPPEPREIPEIIQPITSDILQKIITNLTSKIRGRFKIIHAARDVKATLGLRTSFIDPTILDSLRTLSISTVRPDEVKWDKFRSLVESFLDKKLEPNPTQLLVRDADLRLPASLVGGGEQAILGLMWQLFEKDSIFGIEEPENHLHPKLSRFFFKFLKNISVESQIFIVSHSPIFVDKSTISNNWVVWKEERETRIKRIENKDDFKLILHELGVLPSDMYLKDFVIFVEGGTEKEAILPILARKLSLETEDSVAIKCVGGEPRLRDYLRMWLDVIRYAPIDYLIILDQHARGLAFELASQMNIDLKKFFILGKGSIEDYYPLDILVSAINELFGLNITEKEINPKEPRDKEIQRILETNKRIRKHWKIDIGEYIAEKMPEKNIPVEIRDAIEYVKQQIHK